MGVGIHNTNNTRLACICHNMSSSITPHSEILCFHHIPVLYHDAHAPASQVHQDKSILSTEENETYDVCQIIEQKLSQIEGEPEYFMDTIMNIVRRINSVGGFVANNGFRFVICKCAFWIYDVRYSPKMILMRSIDVWDVFVKEYEKNKLATKTDVDADTMMLEA